MNQSVSENQYLKAKKVKEVIANLQKSNSNREDILRKKAQKIAHHVIDNWPAKYDSINYDTQFDTYAQDPDMIPTIIIDIDYDSDFIKVYTYNYKGGSIALFSFPSAFLWKELI